MEDELWKQLYPIIQRLGMHRPSKAQFTDGQIISVLLWAVTHDRPISWACRTGNWPIHLRRRKRPSPATLSRRLRSRSVQQIL